MHTCFFCRESASSNQLTPSCCHVAFSLLSAQINNKWVKTTIYTPTAARLTRPVRLIGLNRASFVPVLCRFLWGEVYFVSVWSYCPPVVKATHCLHSCTAAQGLILPKNFLLMVRNYYKCRKQGHSMISSTHIMFCYFTCVFAFNVQNKVCADLSRRLFSHSSAGGGKSLFAHLDYQFNTWNFVTLKLVWSQSWSDKQLVWCGNFKQYTGIDNNCDI